MPWPVVLCLLLAVVGWTTMAEAQDDSSAAISFTADQLDNLLAPIALYADPLLAQILLAATFPDQVDEAARFVRANADPNIIDSQAWDVSVKAVAHYPTVLEAMADDLDWTAALGQAYVLQPDDVLASIQRLRHQAESVGNLATNSDQQVVDDADGDIEIWPEDAQFIYVPLYDSSVVFFGRAGSMIGFTKGFRIGAWLNHEPDWHLHHIVYAPWRTSKGWRPRSLPYVHLNSIYVNDTYRTVNVNRNVVQRKLNYSQLERYDSLHVSTTYGPKPPDSSLIGDSTPVAPNNKMIERNIDTRDPRIAASRGHEAPVQQLRQPREIQTTRNVEPPRQPDPPRPAEPQGASAFGGGSGAFSVRESSQRGQESRQEMTRPAPPQPRPVEEKKR
jgi:hypothetical protein